MILTAERIMHSRLYGSGRHITAILVHALFADHTIKTPNLISERPPRGDLFTLIESTTEPQLCCGASVAIGTKRTFQPPLRLSAFGQQQTTVNFSGRVVCPFLTQLGSGVCVAA